MKRKNLTLQDAIREFLWNYPVYIKRLFVSTSPLSYILVFLLLGLGIFSAVSAGSLDKYILKNNRDRIVEGTVGTVGYVNPMFLPQSQVDKDIHALLYEKFIEIDIEGNPIAHIATSWTSSEDGRRYDFQIDTGLYWSDGEKLTADDVVFTFTTARILSTQYGKDTFGNSLEGLRVEKTGDYSVRFIADERNATFFESIAVYIVPEHRFEGINFGTIESSLVEDFPVGSGPYRMVRRTDSMVLMEANPYYVSDVKIETFEYRLYPTAEDLEVAFRNGQLDTVGNMWLKDISYVNEYSKMYSLLETPLPFRKKIMFVNNRVSPLSSSSLRKGLNHITERQKLIDESRIDGSPTDTTFSTVSWAYDDSTPSLNYDPQKAVEEFESAGYTRDSATGFYETEDGKILTLTLTYLQNDMNEALAQTLKNVYESEGVLLDLDPQEFDQMTEETIATRDFELLLYELEITVDPDQYNLWHSLRVDFPNLNLAGYNFVRADLLLERGRENVNRTVRIDNYSILQRLLANDAPVVVLYEPKYNYVVSKRVKGVNLDSIYFASDRFSNIADWELE